MIQVLKLKIAICFALIAGILTIIVSILKDIRILTTLYRMVVSAVIFGLVGYICGYITDNFLKVLLEKLKPAGENIDITTEPKVMESPSQVVSNNFSPFTKNDFEHIS